MLNRPEDYDASLEVLSTPLLRAIDLIIRLCLQNNKHLSGRKRTRHFAELTDAEVATIETVTQEVF